VTLLAAVTGIGKVYGYRPYVDSEAGVKEKYMPAGSGIIHVWFVTRAATQALAMSAGATGVVRQTHEVTIIGLRSIQNDVDGEQKHQEMAEAVWEKLKDNHHMPAGKYALGAPQVPEFGAELFMNVACWSVRITVPVTKRSVP